MPNQAPGQMLNGKTTPMRNFWAGVAMSESPNYVSHRFSPKNETKTKQNGFFMSMAAESTSPGTVAVHYSFVTVRVVLRMCVRIFRTKRRRIHTYWGSGGVSPISNIGAQSCAHGVCCLVQLRLGLLRVLPGKRPTSTQERNSLSRICYGTHVCCV